MTEFAALTGLSDALAARVAQAATLVAAVSWGNRSYISAVHWQDGVVVTSEQSLPRASSYAVTLASGEQVAATLAGRDPSTNVAVLKLATLVTAPTLPPAGSARAGGLVLALGSDGGDGTTAHFGAVEVAGPAWDSMAGGRIDSLIRLGLRLGRKAEGGPVIDAHGRLLGMSTFGPRQTVLVIPTATIARVLPNLVTHGTPRRGWLGVGVHQVALPKEMAGPEGGCGLMVVSVAEGAPAHGVVLPGDILVALDGTSVSSARRLQMALGPERVGSAVALKLVRGGAEMTVTVTIGARPATGCHE